MVTIFDFCYELLFDVADWCTGNAVCQIEGLFYGGWGSKLTSGSSNRGVGVVRRESPAT